MKKRNIAFIMDPIENIAPPKDTTFALMLEAQKRDWNIFYLTCDQLLFHNNEVVAHAIPLKLIDREKDFFQFLSDAKYISLCEFDVVWMRKDPPFDQRFLYATYLLDLAKKQGCFIVNDPTSIRNANEKLLALQFPQCCPATLVTAHSAPLLDFLSLHSSIIIKPLGYRGGHGVLLLQENDPNRYAMMDLLTESGTLPVIAQRYIPTILTQGDKRVLIINGEAYPYALVRRPKPGDLRGNLSAGATGSGTSLTDHDRWIVQQVGPFLKERGLYFVGADIIGDYLTELNVTSPTCVREIDNIFQVNICQEIWNKLL